MVHLHVPYLRIDLGLISTGGDIHRTVNTGLEEDALGRMVVLDMGNIDVRTGGFDISIDMGGLMGDTQRSRETGKELLTEREAVGVFLPWDVLDVHLGEDLGEELHTVLVIQSEELVVLLLGDVMADGLAVDDGGHAELDFTLSTFVLAFGFLLLALLNLWLLGLDALDTDLLDIDGTAMGSFPEPAFALLDVPAIDGILIEERTLAVLHRLIHFNDVVAIDFKTGLTDADTKLLVDLGLGLVGQRNVDGLLAVEHIHCDGILEILSDDSVDDGQTVGYGYVLQ